MTSELGPVQAGLRFCLELAALVAWGMAAWSVPSATPARVVAAALAVLAGATLWGAFRVPGDASANGGAPVAVPGPVRLLLELVLLLGAAVAVAVTGAVAFGVVLGVLVVAHYASTPARIRWLLRH